MTFMKKSIFLPFVFLLMFAISSASCSNEDVNENETTITINDLPSTAQAFLNKYFHGYNVVKIEKDVETDITIYEVELEEGFEVFFNGTGEWQQVVAPYGKTLPTGFIPEQVMATLDQRFPGYGINQVNTTGQGYKVELSDNQGGASIDVFFDMSGEITGIDQLD